MNVNLIMILTAAGMAAGAGILSMRVEQAREEKKEEAREEEARGTEEEKLIYLLYKQVKEQGYWSLTKEQIRLFKKAKSCHLSPSYVRKANHIDYELDTPAREQAERNREIRHTTSIVHHIVNKVLDIGDLASKGGLSGFEREELLRDYKHLPPYVLCKAYEQTQKQYNVYSDNEEYNLALCDLLIKLLIVQEERQNEH